MPRWRLVSIDAAGPGPPYGSVGRWSTGEEDPVGTRTEEEHPERPWVQRRIVVDVKSFQGDIFHVSHHLLPAAALDILRRGRLRVQRVTSRQRFR